MNSEQDPEIITSSSETTFLEIPPEVINKVVESIPDVTVNLPLKDETEKPFLYIPQNFLPDVSLNFLTNILSEVIVSVESTDRAPLALAVSVAPTPEVPLLYVLAGSAAVVAKFTASWK
jgi:hypothetical protein